MSGGYVYKALKKRGYKCVNVDLNTRDKVEIKKIIDEKKIDFIFPVLHGEFGEDGGFQKILEELNIPYAGCDSKSSKKAMDKIATHQILKKKGIQMAPYIVLEHEDDLEKIEWMPCVIKPASGGSSLGTTIVKNKDQLKRAYKLATEMPGKVIVEKFIEGREVTLGILEDKSLPIIEVTPKEEFYDYNAKYDNDETEFTCPAKLDKDVYDKIQTEALKVFKALGCRHFGRVDFRLQDDGEAFCLELNTIPGFTSQSLFPRSSRAAGYEFEDLCEEILKIAIKN